MLLIAALKAKSRDLDLTTEEFSEVITYIKNIKRGPIAGLDNALDSDIFGMGKYSEWRNAAFYTFVEAISAWREKKSRVFYNEGITFQALR